MTPTTNKQWTTLKLSENSCICTANPPKSTFFSNSSTYLICFPLCIDDPRRPNGHGVMVSGMASGRCVGRALCHFRATVALNQLHSNLKNALSKYSWNCKQLSNCRGNCDFQGCQRRFAWQARWAMLRKEKHYGGLCIDCSESVYRKGEQ